MLCCNGNVRKVEVLFQVLIVVGRDESRLFQWSERAGIAGDPVKPNPRYLKLSRTMAPFFRPSNQSLNIGRLNWPLISSTLKTIQSLLTDTKELKDRYNIDVKEIDGADAFSNSGGLSSPSEHKSRFEKLLSKVRSNNRTDNARVIASQNNPGKKLRWAIHDREKFEQLINKLTTLIDRLQGSLEKIDQEFINSALQALLQDLVSGSTESSELVLITQLSTLTTLPNPKAIAAAASLKELRLMLNFDKRNDEKGGAERLALSKSLEGSFMDGIPNLPVLKYPQLKREFPEKTKSGREVASYTYKKTKEEVTVVVEWRSITASLNEKTLEARVQKLALLLHNMSDPSFHGLHCLGYIHDTTSHKFAFIYSAPVVAPKQTPGSPLTIQPLQQTLLSSRKPSLSERIRIALALAETVLQLHTSGWLHKGIRSENILFLDQGQRNWQSGTSMGPYLTGYEYARADKPSEITEDMPSVPPLDIYRHPATLNPQRPGYRKAYDLYGLGCVFLEIALWSRLQDIYLLTALPGIGVIDHSRPTSQTEWGQILSAKPKNQFDPKLASLLQQVAFHSGDTFADVTTMCLSAADTQPDSTDADVSIQTQLTIVEKLKQCRI